MPIVNSKSVITQIEHTDIVVNQTYHCNIHGTVKHIM